MQDLLCLMQVCVDCHVGLREPCDGESSICSEKMSVEPCILDLKAAEVVIGCAEANGQLSGVLLKVVEDTPTVYNLLVCTLCSCYPISILGMAPSWYKVRPSHLPQVYDNVW